MGPARWLIGEKHFLVKLMSWVLNPEFIWYKKTESPRLSSDLHMCALYNGNVYKFLYNQINKKRNAYIIYVIQNHFMIHNISIFRKN